MLFIIEPILAGVIVGLLNKYLFNSSSIIYDSCKTEIIEEEEHSSSVVTTVSSDLSEPHVHVHT